MSEESRHAKFTSNGVAAGAVITASITALNIVITIKLREFTGPFSQSAGLLKQHCVSFDLNLELLSLFFYSPIQTPLTCRIRLRGCS